MTRADSFKAQATSKANAYHSEDVLEDIDREQTPWQCLKQNPKIVGWSLFANCKCLFVPW